MQITQLNFKALAVISSHAMYTYSVTMVDRWYGPEIIAGPLRARVVRHCPLT